MNISEVESFSMADASDIKVLLQRKSVVKVTKSVTHPTGLSFYFTRRSTVYRIRLHHLRKQPGAFGGHPPSRKAMAGQAAHSTDN